MTSDRDVMRLAEELRSSVSLFARSVRMDTKTPSTTQSEALEMLERFGPSSIATVAQRRNVKHQSMRLILAQLEELGLAEREDHPSDARVRLFAITGAGRAWLARSRETRVAWIADLIEQALPEQEYQQVRAAAALLRKLIGSREFPGDTDGS